MMISRSPPFFHFFFPSFFLESFFFLYLFKTHFTFIPYDPIWPFMEFRIASKEKKNP